MRTTKQTLWRNTSPNPRGTQHAARSTSRWVPRLALGVGLNLFAWVSAWTERGPLDHYSFFPLWLGFILAVDALTEARSGTSLWRRGKARFIALFFLSVPFWWYFERLNERAQNWHYLFPRPQSAGEYVFWSSLAFSTVVPAVFAVTELLRTFFPRDDTPARTERLSGRFALACIAFGVVTLVLSQLLPRFFFPFLWTSLFLILDPINGYFGEPNMIGWLFRQRAWRAAARLAGAGLICGFFWEMWNAFSMPKWYYTVPWVDFLHLFEMPLLGYGGYLPFALEIFACYHFVRLLLRRTGFFPADYVRV